MIEKAKTEDDAFVLRDLTIFDQRIALVVYPPDDIFALDQSFGDITAYGFDGDVYLTYRSLQSASEEKYRALRDSLVRRFSEPTTTVSPSRSYHLPADDPDGPGFWRRAYDYDSSGPDLRLQQSYVVQAWENDSVRVILRHVDSELWRAPSGRTGELMSLSREEAIVDTSSRGVTLIFEESGRGSIDRWTRRDTPDISAPVPGTTTAKRVAFQKRLTGRLDRKHPALDTLRSIGNLPLDGQKGDVNYAIEQRSSIFSDRQYESINIDPEKVRPFISGLSGADVSYIDADFDSDDSVSSIALTIRPASSYRSLSGLHRDALRLFARRFGTPDLEYVDHQDGNRGHLWYTESKALDLRLGDESIVIKLTILPDPLFFLQPERFNQ